MPEPREPAGPGADPPEADDEELEEVGPNCVLVGAGSFVSGGVLGGLVGLAGGVFKRQGLKVALQEGGTSAKTFALMSGVHSLVTCGLQKLRQKEDVFNQSIAGCASGIALGIGGPPSTMLVNCAGFAAFAFIYELLTTKTAIALTMSRRPLPTALSSRRRASSKGPKQHGGCRLPLCKAKDQLQEVLSLAVPGWLHQDQGCQGKF